MDFFQTATGGLALTLAGVAVYRMLVAWAGRPGHADRWPVLVAATGVGLVMAGANVLAGAIGWWSGHWSYALPLLLQVSFWVLWTTPFMILLLDGYRWLVAHARRPLVVYGLLGAVVLAPLTVWIDNWAARTGHLVMGGGYAIWHDVLVGQAFLWLPVLFYEVARRHWPAPAGEAATAGHW